MKKLSLNESEWETLSAYLDGEMDAQQEIDVQKKLETSADFQQGLEQLKNAQSLLRTQGVVKAPRNFTLTPEMIGQKGAQASTLKIGANWLAGLKLSSAFASAMLLVTFFAHFLYSGTLARTTQMVKDVVYEAPATEVILLEKPSVQAEAEVQSEAAQVEDLELKAAPVEEAPAPPLGLPLYAEGVGGGEVEQPAHPSTQMAGAPAISATNVITSPIFGYTTDLSEANIITATEPNLIYPSEISEEKIEQVYPVTEELPQRQKGISLMVLIGLEIFWAVVALTTGFGAIILYRKYR